MCVTKDDYRCINTTSSAYTITYDKQIVWRTETRNERY